MVEKTLRLALEKGCPVRIMYQSGTAITERTIEVGAVEGDRVTAFCRMRGARRRFSMKNILSARLIENP
jgi:predicted DNA-binding transcriptional regulator YafY